MRTQALIVGFVLLVMSISLASAWPYTLYSNGTIVDLNSSNNMTTTLSITYYNNYTAVNLTEYTYKNYTTEQITENKSLFYNVSNYTINNYILNVSDASAYYNSTDIDAKFLTLAEFNSYKTAAPDTSKGHGFMWAMIIISSLLSIIAIIIIAKAMSG